MVSGSSTVVTAGKTFFTRNLAKYDGGVLITHAYIDASTHFNGFLEFLM